LPESTETVGKPVGHGGSWTPSPLRSPTLTQAGFRVSILPAAERTIAVPQQHQTVS
jgi:hypothetical protein